MALTKEQIMEVRKKYGIQAPSGSVEDPETRITTLRHVFGIDKYKKILENVSILTIKIRKEKRLKEGMTANLENEKQSLLSREKIHSPFRLGCARTAFQFWVSCLCRQRTRCITELKERMRIK